MLALALSLLLTADDGGVSLQDALHAQAPTLRVDVLARALKAYAVAERKGEVKRHVLTVIDYDRPSVEKRLWTFDLATRRLLFEERVAHGKGSGLDKAGSFSNESKSHQSSLGVFLTAEIYQGEHGTSVKLDGLEPGFNDAARRRAVVIHGASYASDAFVKEHGRVGRSWGCPAVRPEVVDALAAAIADGSVLVASASDRAWLDGSTYLK